MNKTNTSILSISGESGGGQLLRSSLSLALVTGRAFQMTNIRGKRPKPGLMRQHLTCVKAAAEVCGAEVEGADLGSTELFFQPGKVVSGDYAFAIGSGGSTTLVLQTLLPALLHAEASSTLRIEGGTHNPMAPPFEFIEQCFLPVLRGMGVHAIVKLERHGFMQAGGGVITAKIHPVKKWKKLKLTERGADLGQFGKVLNAHLAHSIVGREIAAANTILQLPIEATQANDSIGPGNAILLSARFANVCEISTGIAQMGKSAEVVATGAAKGLRGYLSSTAPVGVHLADQLLLPIALAGGGVFHTLSITDHTRTNMALIEQFLPVKFGVEEIAPGVKAVMVK
ncbi:MAG: RNA 3'-terminal phosphate cyclase [Verrucomicrobia bacterium]|nr:RNA 3'-terminal phosphate cyclase [Verrucomicrobiota bacterium]